MLAWVALTAPSPSAPSAKPVGCQQMNIKVVATKRRWFYRPRTALEARIQRRGNCFLLLAKHRGIWPVAWLCAALGVSRSGFHAWLGRSPSARSRSDEVLAVKVRASFVASDRTYGARRVWHDVLAEGISCGLHRIERLMRAQALRARPRRRRRPPDPGERTDPQRAPLPVSTCRNCIVALSSRSRLKGSPRFNTSLTGANSSSRAADRAVAGTASR